MTTSGRTRLSRRTRSASGSVAGAEMARTGRPAAAAAAAKPLA